MLSDKELIKQFKEHQKRSDRGLAEQKERARDSHAFYAGDRMAYEATVTDKGRRRMVVFNKVKPYVDSVAGLMVQLRRKPGYDAKVRESRRQLLYSTFLNSTSDYLRDNANLDQLESRQDKEMLIAGYGALDTNITYEKNPDGDVAGEVVTFSDVSWDPEARESNLLDSRWMTREKKYALEEALTLFPNSEEEDFEPAVDYQQGAFHYNPNGGLYDKIAYGCERDNDGNVKVYYYQYWERVKYWRAENPIFKLGNTESQDVSLVMRNRLIAEQLLFEMAAIRKERLEEFQDENGDSVEDIFEFDPRQEMLSMTPDIKREVQDLFDRFGLEVDFIESLRREYTTAILSGKKVFKKFRSPDQTGFTIKVKTGSWDEENCIWFGMVESLKEPSRYSNKALTEMLFVIASNSKGGVMYEKGAVTDPVRFEQQWATTRAAIAVEDGALSGGKIQPKATASLPNGYQEIYGISNTSLNEVSGINPEFLGSSSNTQVSALLESQRINQVMSALACYFDSITLYQKEHARLMITYMRMLAQNSTNRLIRVVGEDGSTEFQELIEDNFAQEYDVELQEVPTTPAQKQEQAQIMINFAQSVAQFGQNVYTVAIDYLPIKDSDKAKLKQLLSPQQAEPTPEELQAQQEARQLLVEGQKAQIANQIADTQNKVADSELKQASALDKALAAELKAAESEKVEAETVQKEMENAIIARRPSVDNLNINI